MSCGFPDIHEYFYRKTREIRLADFHPDLTALLLRALATLRSNLNPSAASRSVLYPPKISQEACWYRVIWGIYPPVRISRCPMGLPLSRALWIGLSGRVISDIRYNMQLPQIASERVLNGSVLIARVFPFSLNECRDGGRHGCQSP